MPMTALNLTTRPMESLSHESALSMIRLSYDSAVFEKLFEKRTSRRIRDICENIEGYESVAQGEMIDKKKQSSKISRDHLLQERAICIATFPPPPSLPLSLALRSQLSGHILAPDQDEWGKFKF